MKNKILPIIAVVLLIAAAGVCLYPTASQWINQMLSQSEIVRYNNIVNTLSAETKNEQLSKAKEYNKNLSETISDSFSPDAFESDEKYLKTIYRFAIGKKLDTENPCSFNEKLQWLKIHDRNPLYTTMVDKYEVKEYVADKIGSKYIIPTIGVWNSFDEIDFDSLPDKFVLKCTHDSGGLVICRNKQTLDKDKARKICT